MEVLTTLPHFLAIHYSPNLVYTTVVFTSSSLSVLWHMGYDYLAIPDHVVAGIWFLTDCYFSYNTNLFYIILFANIIIALLNYLLSYTYLDYTIGHSIWHILSSIKAIGVTYCLKTNLHLIGSN